jgi:membrane protein
LFAVDRDRDFSPRNILAKIRAQSGVQYAIKQWHNLPYATRTLPSYIWGAIMSFKNHGLKNAAALSYYAVFSVFPLTLLLSVGVSAVLGPAVAQEQIYQGLALFVPEETQVLNLIQESLQQAMAQSTGFGIIALISLMWSALGLFSNLTSSLDRIFQVPASRSMFKERLLAFSMTLALILLVVASFITSGVLRLLDAFLLTSPNIWIRIGVFFLPFGLNIVIFVLLFRYVPSRHVSWDAVWPASILGSVMLEFAKSLFTTYISELANYQFVYGSIATVIVLMVWAYLTTSILLINAEICSHLNLWFIANAQQKRHVSVFVDTDIERLPKEIPPPV